MRKQTGSTEVIIMAGLAILLAAALGFIFWQNFVGKSGDTNTNTGDVSEVKGGEEMDEIEEAVVEEGTITGSLTYPSHDIPPSLTIHATNLATGKEFTTTEHLSGSQYKYGKGYRLAVPTGTYHVYATVGDSAYRDQRAYHTNFVVCELSFNECGSAENANQSITVTVKPGQDTHDVLVGDWYNLCLTPGSEQPTEKFDLPTC